MKVEKKVQVDYVLTLNEEQLRELYRIVKTESEFAPDNDVLADMRDKLYPIMVPLQTRGVS